jgi:RNA polymerase sigma factor (sigma-70 family)
MAHIARDDSDGTEAGADIIIHASATAAGLSTAIAHAGFEARIVELSWYGEGTVPAPLGGAFHSRRLQLVEDDAVLDAGTPRSEQQDVSSPLIQRELAEVARKILDRMPEKYRTILLLREYEDLSYTDIAGVLGIQLGTVESRLFRARQRFKEMLERLHPEHAPSRGGDQ